MLDDGYLERIESAGRHASCQPPLYYLIKSSARIAARYEKRAATLPRQYYNA